MLKQVCKKSSVSGRSSLSSIDNVLYESNFGEFIIQDCKRIRDEIWMELRNNSVPVKIGDEVIYRIEIQGIGVVRLSIDRRDDISCDKRMGMDYNKVDIEEVSVKEDNMDPLYIDMYDFINMEGGLDGDTEEGLYSFKW